ncbi:hypothetical protein D7030_14840 [Flavobacteriaceae bacterium AU392]|nr:hypothetical protein D1817_03650 [Flavobacteriaceae bacterium]RKM81573.1 hypothetical protein D7030_14840 [Flavobacteriaceae bacterium AU392]
MKYLFVLFIFSTISFAQENNQKINPIETYPIYLGCEKKKDIYKQRKCFQTKISKHISSNLKKEFLSSLGLPAKEYSYNVKFKINKQGKVINIEVDIPHEMIKNEIIRIFKLIPEMVKPGYINNEAVEVPMFIPVKFKISETQKSKQKVQQSIEHRRINFR